MVYFCISCFSILSAQAAHRTVSVGMKQIISHQIVLLVHPGKLCRSSPAQQLFILALSSVTQQHFQTNTCLESCLYAHLYVYLHTCAPLHFRDIKILQELMEQILALLRERNTLAM